MAQHNNKTLKQLQFLYILRHFILDKGEVTRQDLVAPPFTQVHPDGILGVFKSQEINEIIELTQRITA